MYFYLFGITKPNSFKHNNACSAPESIHVHLDKFREMSQGTRLQKLNVGSYSGDVCFFSPCVSCYFKVQKRLFSYIRIRFCKNGIMI